MSNHYTLTVRLQPEHVAKLEAIANALRRSTQARGREKSECIRQLIEDRHASLFPQPQTKNAK